MAAHEELEPSAFGNGGDAPYAVPAFAPAEPRTRDPAAVKRWKAHNAALKKRNEVTIEVTFEEYEANRRARDEAKKQARMVSMMGSTLQDSPEKLRAMTPKKESGFDLAHAFGDAADSVEGAVEGAVDAVHNPSSPGGASDASSDNEEELRRVEAECHNHMHIWHLRAVLRKLNISYDVLGDRTKQLRLLDEAANMDPRMYGRDPEEIALCMCNLAQCYAALGQFEKKRTLLEKVLTMQEAAFGRHSPVLAPLCMDIAQMCAKAGDNERRRGLVEQARRIWTKEYGADDPNARWCATILEEQFAPRNGEDAAPDYESEYWRHEKERLRASGVCAIT